MTALIIQGYCAKIIVTSKLRKRGEEMNLIELTAIHLETYFENRTESDVKRMKQFIDEKLGSPINANTFYTIINKLKKKGFLIHGENRGMYRLNRELKIDKEKLQTASDFVKEMYSLISIDDEYYKMMNESYLIDLWSVTPELSECVQILREIADGKEKLDYIVQKSMDEVI